jgi:hypothetical protein
MLMQAVETMPRSVPVLHEQQSLDEKDSLRTVEEMWEVYSHESLSQAEELPWLASVEMRQSAVTGARG